MPAKNGLYRLVYFLPVILLVTVAFVQIGLANYSYLSPWSGGGFGMFSTTDVGSARHVHIYAVTPSVRRELIPNTKHKKIVDQLLVFPADYRIKNFSEQLRDIFYIPEEGDVKLDIQVWKKTYDPRSLEPTSEIINSMEIPYRE